MPPSLGQGASSRGATPADVLGDLSIDFYPGAVQILMIIAAVFAVLFALMYRGPLSRLGEWLGSATALRTLGLGSTIYMALVIALISIQSGGLVNVMPGAWVSFVGAMILLVGSAGLTPRAHRDPLHASLPSWVEILTIVVLLAIALFGAAYVLDIEDGTVFSLVLLFVAIIALTLTRAGFFTWVGIITQTHRRVLMLGAVAVAFLFPFTQDGSDANMSIATQVLIFASTALGLNIVVGLAGLLDLGYIAFLGAGAYVGAIFSHSAFSTIGWKPPFVSSSSWARWSPPPSV